MAEDSCLKNCSDVARERIKFSGLVKNNNVFYLYFKIIIIILNHWLFIN